METMQMTRPPQILSDARERAHQRRLDVAQLRQEGYRDQYQIAVILGVSKSTISNDFAIVNRWWREQAAVAVDEEIHLELSRLDAALRVVMPLVAKGNLKAVDRLLAIIDRRIRLLGLEAPKRLYVASQQVVREYVGIDPVNFDSASLDPVGSHQIDALGQLGDVDTSNSLDPFDDLAG
jgi:hypothetical protein